MPQKEDAHFVYLHQVFCRPLLDDSRGYFRGRLAAVMLQRSLVSVCLGATASEQCLLTVTAAPVLTHGTKTTQTVLIWGDLPLKQSMPLYTLTCTHKRKRVWLPLQGQDRLSCLSHSWVVLTSAWASGGEREVEKVMQGGCSSLLQIEGIREKGGWLRVEKMRTIQRVSEGNWKVCDCPSGALFFFSVSQVHLYSVLWGSDEFQPPCGASSHCVYQCTPLSLLVTEDWNTAGVLFTWVNGRVCTFSV